MASGCVYQTAYISVYNMKHKLGIIVFASVLLSGCGSYNKLYKSTDYDYKYEAAKQYFVEGQYSKAATLLDGLITVLKGTDKAEESLFMQALCQYKLGDYTTASQYFTTYYTGYPKGIFAETARYMSGKALYLDTPDPRLDQTSSMKAISELQNYLDYYPDAKNKEEVQNLIFSLQDQLVEKEYMSARLYYNLGTYIGNCNANNESNYESCVITAQNALKDYPYAKRREDLSFLIVEAKYELARNSVEDKQADRYRDAIDEYYGFKNEFPESKYMPAADKMFKAASAKVKEEGNPAANANS